MGKVLQGNAPYHSPRFYSETVSQQDARLKSEQTKINIHHTLVVVRRVCHWLETQRILGNLFNPVNVQVEAGVQCKLNGVVPEHVPAATELIVDIYLQRG